MDCASFDFLAIRVMHCNTLKVLIEDLLCLTMENFTPCEPDYRYKNAVACGNIRIYFNGMPGMGMCVVMTGQGCRQYCAMRHNEYEIILLLHRLKPEDRVTRLDYALDDLSDVLDLDLLLEKHRNKELRTKIREMNVHFDRGGFVQSICYGSPRSIKQIRIYDKAVESDYDGCWKRVELMLRKNEANRFVRRFQQAVDAKLPLEEQGDAFRQIAAGVLMQNLAYVDKTSSNISRCPICSWWKEFLSVSKGLRLHAEAHITEIRRTEVWLQRIVAQSLAAMTMILGPDWLLDLLKRGISRNWKPNSVFRLLLKEVKAEGMEPAILLDDAAEKNLLELLEAAICARKEKQVT